MHSSILDIFPKTINGKKVVKYIPLKGSDILQKDDCYTDNGKIGFISHVTALHKATAGYYFCDLLDKYCPVRPVFKQKLG